jgi:enterochelin esterase-like enzyme
MAHRSLFVGLVVFLLTGFILIPASNVKARSLGADTAIKQAPANHSGDPCADSYAAGVTPFAKSVQPAAPLLGASIPGAAQAELKLLQDPLQADTPVSSTPVKLETVTIFSTFLGGAERIAQVYLPGDYADHPDGQYPVLYALDGQQLPDINYSQTLSDLFSSGEVSPFITVAVFSTEGDLRREELGTGATLNLFGWGTQSEAFNQFMVEELVPKINSTYRVLPGAQNSAVMGWSLGGLTSFYLAWQYPETFGKVGAFSPSFWWRTESLPGEELQARVIPNLVQGSSARPGLKLWFEAGTKELPYSDIDGNGVIDMIQDVQDVMNLLAQKGYQMETDMTYVQVEGGLHELSTWETVVPDFLRFAFPVT